MKAAPDLFPSDEHLVRAYLGGSNGSLGMLYQRYYTKVYHQCLSFARNQEDAFDLAQDILMKAFGNLSKFGGKSRFSTWLFSVTRNHCISYATRVNRTGVENLGSRHDQLADYPETEGFEERSRREDMELNLDEYLGRLSEDDRKMLELKYLYNYSVKELQQEFVLSASAVKMRLLRARNRIEQLHRASYAA